MSLKPKKSAYLYAITGGDAWAVWRKHSKWNCTDTSVQLRWMIGMSPESAVRELKNRRIPYQWESRESIFPTISTKTSQSAAPRTIERGQIEASSPPCVKSPLLLKNSAIPTRLAEEWTAIREGRSPRPCLTTAMHSEGPVENSLRSKQNTR